MNMLNFNNIEWFGVDSRIQEKIITFVQEGFIRRLSSDLNKKNNTWESANLFRTVFKFRKGIDSFYTRVRFTSKAIIEDKLALKSYLDYHISNYQNRMDKDLNLEDFDFIIVDPKKNSGYYSFKGNGYEICLEEEKSGWEVLVCNSRQEVLETKNFNDKTNALNQANEFHKGLITTF